MIGETFPIRTDERNTCPVPVIHAVCDPVVIPEFELGNVPVKVLLSAMLIGRPSSRA